MEFNVGDTVKILDCSKEPWFANKMTDSIGCAFKIQKYDTYDNMYQLSNDYWYAPEFMKNISETNELNVQKYSELTVQSSIDFLISQGYIVSLSKN